MGGVLYNRQSLLLHLYLWFLFNFLKRFPQEISSRRAIKKSTELKPSPDGSAIINNLRTRINNLTYYHIISEQSISHRRWALVPPRGERGGLWNCGMLCCRTIWPYGFSFVLPYRLIQYFLASHSILLSPLFNTPSAPP